MPITRLDDIDDFFRREEENRRTADGQVQPWQASVKKGDYFVRQSGDLDVPIYGQVLRNAYRQKHLQNYRFTKCYSILCPDGEMGDVHVSTLQRILRKEEFDEARKHGWRQ